MTRTVWWEEGRVKMIDQRILPLVFEIATYDSFQDVAEAIRDMVVRGAPAIGASAPMGWRWRPIRARPRTGTAC